MKLNRSSELIVNFTESPDTEKYSVGWSSCSPSYFNDNHDSGDKQSQKSHLNFAQSTSFLLGAVWWTLCKNETEKLFMPKIAEASLIQGKGNW